MQLSIKNVAVAFAVLGRTTADSLASPTGGFINYCDNIAFVAPHGGLAGYWQDNQAFYFEDDGSLALQADCTGTGPMGPPSLCSTLNMNQCFGVISGGAIVKQENGNFQKTCNQIEALEDDDWFFTCMCPTGQSDNPWVKNFVDANQVVSAINGYLQCFSQVGEKCVGAG